MFTTSAAWEAPLFLRSIFFPLFFGCFVWHAGSSFPDQESNLCLLQWKQGVLTTEQQRSPSSVLNSTWPLVIPQYQHDCDPLSPLLLAEILSSSYRPPDLQPQSSEGGLAHTADVG